MDDFKFHRKNKNGDLEYKDKVGNVYVKEKSTGKPLPKSCPVIHWTTWKKRNQPKMKEWGDSSLGFVYSIKPTLLALGFQHTTAEKVEGMNPIDVVRSMSFSIKCKEVVYTIYNHSRGYCSYIEVFYK